MQEAERLVIDRLGHRGDGIAPGPVFVPGALPGEIVEGVRAGDRLADVRILEPSSDRVAAPCRHYRSCGGCTLQHASDQFVAEWKRDVVRAALSAQGLSAEVGPVITSSPRSRRRAVFAARRTKKGALAGFFGRASEVIAEIAECQLLEPALMAGLPLARDLAIAGASRKGALAVTVCTTENGLDVAVAGGKPADGRLRADLAGLAEAHGLARLAWDGEVIAARQAAIQRFGGVAVDPPPGTFLQATRAGEAALLAEVEAATAGARRVVDLFAGAGTFSLPLAARAEVHAVEADAGMLRALDRGWRRGTGLRKVTCEARDLFRRPLTAADLAGYDAVLIDPPRAGAAAQVAELATARVPVIAALSCNPVTFARDAKVLSDAGYLAGPIRVIDQFRWSAHVELAASFRLPHMNAHDRTGSKG
ncbi:MAG: class I SAM-dependent RNA methyltransferase [Marinibacterium sp.]